MKATGFTSTAQGSAVIQKRGTTLPVTTLTPECRGRANTHGLAFSLLVQKIGVGRNGTLVKPCTLKTSSSPLLSLITSIAEARESDAVAVVYRKATLTRNISAFFPMEIERRVYKGAEVKRGYRVTGIKCV